MSEKTVWKWLNKVMNDYDGWGSCRFEKCCEKGIPDSVVTLNYGFNKYTTFVEIKDWSGARIHPLSIEQKNFLEEFGGVVIIKLPHERVAIVPGKRKGISALLSCDIEWAMNNADIVIETSVNNYVVRDQLALSLSRHGGCMGSIS